MKTSFLKLVSIPLLILAAFTASDVIAASVTVDFSNGFQLEYNPDTIEHSGGFTLVDHKHFLGDGIDTIGYADQRFSSVATSNQNMNDLFIHSYAYHNSNSTETGFNWFGGNGTYEDVGFALSGNNDLTDFVPSDSFTDKLLLSAQKGYLWDYRRHLRGFNGTYNNDAYITGLSRDGVDLLAPAPSAVPAPPAIWLMLTGLIPLIRKQLGK